MARLVVALTGGVASGKSEVARRFAALGITVADADALARDLVAKGQPTLADVVARFGEEVVANDGNLDRRRLRELVFRDAGARRDLEAILHPRIRTALQHTCAVAPSPYALADIPLLAEAGGRAAYRWVDRVLVVDAPREVQLTRLLARDGISLELAMDMLAAQSSRQVRLDIADDVIDNSGALAALDPQVGELHERYLRLARSA